jgi:hypothetical protein
MQSATHHFLLFAAVLAVCAACAPPHHHTVHGCSPLATDQCVTPFPNAWFEQPDSATATGEAVLFPDHVLPVENTGTPIAPDLMGPVDGFSPGTVLIAWFKQGVDATQLTPSTTSPIDDRIQLLSRAGAPIVVINLATRKTIPIFAELDANAIPSMGDRQALLIHPMVRLEFGTRYAVAITTALHDASGAPLAPEGQFQKWANGTLTPSDSLWEISDRLDADAKVFATIGIQKKNLALAWDFDTASASATTGDLTGMITQTFASSPDGFGYTIDSVVDNTPAQDSNSARVITGTFQAPSFETGPDPSILKLDAHGKPVMGALASWNFTAVISQCAATKTDPVPLLVMGHGVFSTGNAEVTGDADIVQRICGVGIGADWLGLSSSDIAVLTKVLADPNQFRLITDRLAQAHLNFQVLARLATRKLGMDPRFILGSAPVLTPSSPVNYWGPSNGGIQGTTFMSVSPDAQRGVLIVPGGEWSLLMWRSGDFAAMLEALQSVLPDKLDLQLVTAMSQSLWDLTDPVEFSTLLPGTTKAALFQESIGDPVVSNVTTRLEMRTIGANALAQLVQPVFELIPAQGPLEGLVYTQWSIDPMPMPPYANVPGPSSNGAHQAIGGIPEAVDQAVQFMLTGQVQNTCGAASCVFPQ